MGRRCVARGFGTWREAQGGRYMDTRRSHLQDNTSGVRTSVACAHPSGGRVPARPREVVAAATAARRRRRDRPHVRAPHPTPSTHPPRPPPPRGMGLPRCAGKFVRQGQCQLPREHRRRLHGAVTPRPIHIHVHNHKEKLGIPPLVCISYMQLELDLRETQTARL